MTAYQMEINNIAAYLQRCTPKEAPASGYDKKERAAFDAFDASSILAVAHCKSKEEILQDIVRAGANK